jgi:ketosteroid isomerase-like protein
VLQLYRTVQPDYESWNLSEGTAQTFHGNTVILTGKIELQGTVDGKNVSGNFRFTRVWIKQGLDWQLAAEQMTRIAG